MTTMSTKCKAGRYMEDHGRSWKIMEVPEGGSPWPFVLPRWPFSWILSPSGWPCALTNPSSCPGKADLCPDPTLRSLDAGNIGNPVAGCQ